MKINIAPGTAALFMLVFAAGSSVAQVEKQTAPKKTRTLSGCLQKQNEDDPSKFQLTTAGNVTWEIQSDSVELAPHAGETVTVTGVVTLHEPKKDTQDKAKQHGVAKGAAGHGRMAVTGLKIDSDKCNN